MTGIVHVAARRVCFTRWSVVAVVWSLCVSAASAQESVVPQAVQTVKQIRAKNQANVPVTLRGVVTGTDVVRFYLQDETGAIGVTRANVLQPISPGDLVEVKGTTSGLGAGLGVNGAALTKMSAAPLPKPEGIKADRLENGGAACQRVRLSGSVHEVGLSSGSQVLQVQSSGTSFIASFPGDHGGAQLALSARKDLLDAVVEVEGVAVPLFSNAGSMKGFRLVMASADHIKVVRAGSDDPFSRPLRTLKSLRESREPENERVRVRGTVNYWSDAGWFHFEDETDVARADNAHFIPQATGWPYRPDRSEPMLKPGDIIELVGLPVPNRKGMPSFSRCEWRVVGQGALPSFEPVSATDIAMGQYEGRAVSLTGRVTDTDVSTDYLGYAIHTLWIESAGAQFTAIYQKRHRATMPVKAGDYVRLSGSITQSPAILGRSTVFRLNLNQLTDIHPVPPPPAWKSPVVKRWLAAGAAAAALAFFWIISLRRQVAAQTAQLRLNARTLQAQLDQEKELSDMKSRFVFTVSHEFRNPLAVIMSCSDVLQRMRDDLAPEHYQRQIEGIRQSVRRMAAMMEEVLLLGRAEAGQLQCAPEETDLLAFCQKVVDQTCSATAGKCPVRFDPGDMLVPAKVDRSLLQHILTNLLSNAVKYSPAGEPVTLSARHEGGECVFRVADLGVGIPPDDLARIFDPFHRGANVGTTPGTGLGLAIVKRCVTAHGGRIECECPAGGGAIFTVSLPCDQA